jgi:hypothetical protein
MYPISVLKESFSHNDSPCTSALLLSFEEKISEAKTNKSQVPYCNKRERAKTRRRENVLLTHDAFRTRFGHFEYFWIDVFEIYLD